MAGLLLKPSNLTIPITTVCAKEFENSAEKAVIIQQNRRHNGNIKILLKQKT